MTDISIEEYSIEEYKEQPIHFFSIDDENYLKNYFLNEQPRAFRINRRLDKDEKNIRVLIENTSYAGVIQLKNSRLCFSTKVKANLFYMLSFLKSEKNFVFDPRKVIDIDEGGSFFDVIGKLFLNELEDIVNKGMLKKYITYEENSSYLKGKLLMQDQIKQNLLLKPKFYCRHHDLTYDNLENQIVLRAADLLIPMIRFNEKLKYDLVKLENELQQYVSLNTALSQRDCDLISYNRLNQRYETIIDFSRLIFQEAFIKSVGRGKSKGFNFIVNMWKVYEDFVSQMIEEVVRDNPGLSEKYEVATQFSFNSLVIDENGKGITTKPDILIKEKNSNFFPVIIDTKYKKSDTNADFYQVIAYSLAIKGSKKCCLVYPESDMNERRELTVLRDVLDKKIGTVKLYTRTIRLFEDGDNEDFKSFIMRIKEKEIKPLLIELLLAE